MKIGVATYTLNNGIIITREELIKRNGKSSASIVLPLTQSDEVLLIIQPRVFSKLGVTVEVPAGYRDEFETQLDTAIRELREETGYSYNDITKVDDYYQDQGCGVAFNECFLATGCIKTHEAKLDKDEHITPILFTYEEMLELRGMGFLNDTGSIITIGGSRKILRR